MYCQSESLSSSCWNSDNPPVANDVLKAIFKVILEGKDLIAIFKLDQILAQAVGRSFSSAYGANAFYAPSTIISVVLE